MFQVGDKVYSINFGWGTVEEIGIEYSSDYKVIVRFIKNGTVRAFTLNGKLFKDGNRDLFFEEINIPKSALERPLKSAMEMLKECDEVKFDPGIKKYYIYKSVTNGRIEKDYNVNISICGVKYISEEDAENIVKKCRENN